jgi:hypothetical protein
VTLDPAAFTLRSRFIEAPAATVAGQLAAGYRFAPSIGLDPTAAPVDARITRLDRYALMAEADTGGTAVTVLFLLQPVDGGRAVLHGLVAAAPPGGDRLTVRRHHDFRLDLLRDAAEAAASPVRVVR